MNFSLAATRDHQTETTHSNHLPPCLLQKSYRPVATLSTVSAMAALIDVTGGVGGGGGAKGGGGAVEATSPGGGGADEPSSGGGGEEMCKAAAAVARETNEGGDVEDAAGVADDEAVEEVANGTLF